MNRRQFLMQSAIATAGLASVEARAGRRPRISKLDKLNVGIVGVANRGGDNLGEMELPSFW